MTPCSIEVNISPQRSYATTLNTCKLFSSLHHDEQHYFFSTFRIILIGAIFLPHFSSTLFILFAPFSTLSIPFSDVWLSSYLFCYLLLIFIMSSTNTLFHIDFCCRVVIYTMQCGLVHGNSVTLFSEVQGHRHKNGKPGLYLKLSSYLASIGSLCTTNHVHLTSFLYRMSTQPQVWLQFCMHTLSNQMVTFPSISTRWSKWAFHLQRTGNGFNIYARLEAHSASEHAYRRHYRCWGAGCRDNGPRRSGL